MSKRPFAQHWPVMLLGVVVVLIFLAVLVTFEVKETEYAVVRRFGAPRMEMVDGKKMVKVYPPGPHWKLPAPIDTVWTHDNRLQCYELRQGQVEQTPTADGYQIVVTTYVLWKVGDAGLFLSRLGTTVAAEESLDNIVRNSRSIVLGRHSLTELINADPTKVHIPEIEKEVLDHLRANAMKDYGIDVEYLGFKLLGFPEQVSAKVFARMRAERNRQSEKYRADGRRDAERIRAQADLEASRILSEAEAKAKGIRAEGDKSAAESYAAFRQDPELAAFLRKLDSLRQTLSEKTTLIVDTNTPPYDLLLPGATDLAKDKQAPEPKAQAQGEKR